jgi:hypothetical protein
VTSGRDRLVAILDELNTTIGAAAVALEASQVDNRRFREGIVREDPLPEAMIAVTVPEVMGDVARALKNLEETRHRSRTAVFAVGMAEGVSIGELARLYGFSRQLAQRFAKEARGRYALVESEQS